MVTIEKLKEWALALEKGVAHVNLDDDSGMWVCDADVAEEVMADIERAIADLYREEARGS